MFVRLFYRQIRISLFFHCQNRNWFWIQLLLKSDSTSEEILKTDSDSYFLACNNLMAKQKPAWISVGIWFENKKIDFKSDSANPLTKIIHLHQLRLIQSRFMNQRLIFHWFQLFWHLLETKEIKFLILNILFTILLSFFSDHFKNPLQTCSQWCFGLSFFLIHQSEYRSTN